MAAPTAETVVIDLSFGLGSVPGDEDIPVQYIEQTATANRLVKIPYKLAASDTDHQVDLTTILDSIVAIVVIDRSNIGVNVGKAAGAGKWSVSANRFMLMTHTTPIILYLDNPDSSNASYGEVVVIGSSS